MSGGTGAAEVLYRWSKSPMAAQKDRLGLIYAGRKIRRPPLVGVKFLHEVAMGAPDLVGARPRLQAKDLISLLFRHFAAPPRTARPRCRVVLHVVTPAGLPAVEISHQ